MQASTLATLKEADIKSASEVAQPIKHKKIHKIPNNTRRILTNLHITSLILLSIT